jgi:DNA-binding response OmpR family regulator
MDGGSRVGGVAPILVVDDDPDVRGSLAALLDDAGFRAAVAGPQEALALARKERPALALLGVLMPGIDGPSLCRRLRDYYGRGLPVIFISTMPEYAVASMAVGCAPWDFLPKPCSDDDLLAAVRRQLPAA